jgi:hypothetical protein
MAVTLKRNALLLQFLHHCKDCYHYHLVSGVLVGPRISHTCLQPGRDRLNIFPLESIASSSRVSGFWPADFLFGSVPQKEINRYKIGTSRRSFYWSSTPNPPTSKLVVKPRTITKHKIWWCSILDEVQFFIIVPLRCNGQREIVSARSISQHWLYDHPVYIYIYICWKLMFCCFESYVIWRTASKTSGWFFFRISYGTANSVCSYFSIRQSMEKNLEAVLLSRRSFYRYSVKLQIWHLTLRSISG